MNRKITWALLFTLLLSVFGPKEPANPHVTKAIFGVDDILILLLIQVVVASLSYLLAPKPQKQKPAAAQDWQNPTAEAGRPIPVIFGTIKVTGSNVLWYGDKSITTIWVQS
jgi:hypothetical protein